MRVREEAAEERQGTARGHLQLAVRPLGVLQLGEDVLVLRQR